MIFLRNRFLSCVFISIVLHSLAGSAEPQAHELQGIWFGDGSHPVSKYVLIVQNDEFIVMSPMGRYASKFVSGEIIDGLTAIDIERYDGKQQLGVYQVDKTKLYLNLAPIGAPRPTKVDAPFASDKSHWRTVLDRRPTPDGLAVLHKSLSKELGLQNNKALLTSIKN